MMALPSESTATPTPASDEMLGSNSRAEICITLTPGRSWRHEVQESMSIAGGHTEWLRFHIEWHKCVLESTGNGRLIVVV